MAEANAKITLELTEEVKELLASLRTAASQVGHFQAQLDAIRAQAVAIVCAVDALIGPAEERCCEKPSIKMTDTYGEHIETCQNCGHRTRRKQGEQHG